MLFVLWFLKVCSPGWCMFVFRYGDEPRARHSTVPRESCGEQANEVSGQMMALSCCLWESMAQRASCRVLSVLCVCPALSATKGSLARRCCGIRWTRPLLPAYTPHPPRQRTVNSSLWGLWVCLSAWLARVPFSTLWQINAILFDTLSAFFSSLASLYLPFSLFYLCLVGVEVSCFLLLVFVFSLSCLPCFVLRCNLWTSTLEWTRSPLKAAQPLSLSWTFWLHRRLC